MKWYEMSRDEFMRTISSFKGPAYYAPKPPADYGPRDTRVWMTACRHRNCPAQRCLEMIEDVDE